MTKDLKESLEVERLEGRDYFRYLTIELDIRPLKAISHMRNNNHDLSWFYGLSSEAKMSIVLSITELQKIKAAQPITLHGIKNALY
tara:strand:- start:405 stop:662 length:258 start_codon:yes stop_codon:yes gene_type:complete